MTNITNLARQATITLAQRQNNDFGPAASGRFDFTILFEDIFLSIVPSALLLLIGPPRLWALYKQPLKVKKSAIHESKLVSYIADSLELDTNFSRALLRRLCHPPARPASPLDNRFASWARLESQRACSIAFIPCITSLARAVTLRASPSCSPINAHQRLPTIHSTL